MSFIKCSVLGKSWEHKKISVTLSSGVAGATKEIEETLNQLLNKADKALYTAKREGRNQVQVYKGV